MNKEDIVKLLMWLGDCHGMDNREHAEKVADNYISENEPKALNIDLVSHYYLTEGDTIVIGDEFQSIDGDNKWRITGQYGNKFSGKKHYPHRRKSNCG